MGSRTKTCIAKSSCEIYIFVAYYRAQSVNSLLTFRDTLLATPSKVRKSERENIKDKWQYLFGADFVDRLIFVSSTTFQNLVLFLFSGEKHLT